MSIIRIDPSFDALVPRDARIEKVAGGFTFTEGPLWRPSGVLWFSDVVGNVVRQWSPDGTVNELLRPGGYDGNSLPAGGFIGPNGMTTAPNGDVLLCQHGNRRIVQVTNDLRVTTLVDKFDGKRLNAPNDLVFRSDGTLFFTDPPYGLPRQDDDPEKDIPFNGVFKVSDGKVEVDHQGPDAAQRNCVFAGRENAVRVELGRQAAHLDAVRHRRIWNGEQRPRLLRYDDSRRWRPAGWDEDSTFAAISGRPDRARSSSSRPTERTSARSSRRKIRQIADGATTAGRCTSRRRRVSIESRRR